MREERKTKGLNKVGQGKDEMSEGRGKMNRRKEKKV